MDDQKSENNMTPEERLAWLRERGVQVVTSEERHAAGVVDAMREANSIDPSTLPPMDPISYVLIPSDTSKPLQELSFVPRPNPKKAVPDLLAEYLKPAFSTNSDKVDISLLERQPHGGEILGTADAKVSPETLKKVAKEGHVEIFTLVHPTPSNKQTGMNIYLDEVGMLKRLPLNTRASDYARRAGFEPPPQFYGDVFLGRIHKVGNFITQNISITVGKDTAFDAEWLQRATTENLEYQMQMNKITGRNDTQPAVAGDGTVQKEDGYSWTQSEEELELSVPIKDDSVVSKDISVKFKPQSINVTCKKQVLVSLILFERVDVDGCTWTLDKGKDGRKLVVTMEKVEQALWPRIKD